MGKTIINEIIKIKWNKNNKQYYIKRNYMFTKYGDEFEIDIKDLPKSTEMKIDVLCDYCNKIKNIPYKNYNNLKGDTYCCVECLKHKKKVRDINDKLIFVEIPYRNKDWLYDEYITKDREAKDIASDFNINVRTLRDWISKFNFKKKNEIKKEKITKEIIEELYFKQYKTTDEIGNMFGISGNTVVNVMRDFGLDVLSRSELMKIYYDKKGGREKIREYSNRPDIKILSSCRQRNIPVSEFDGFSTLKSHRLRCGILYKEWRSQVFRIDNHTCQCCGKRGGVLNAHHILNFSENENLIYDINNGITLCDKCHLIKYKNSFHSIYGEKNNTKEQLEEYIKNRKHEGSE